MQHESLLFALYYTDVRVALLHSFSNIGIISATGLVTILKSSVMSKATLFPPNGVCP